MQYVDQKREEGVTGLELGADFSEMFKELQKRFYEAALEAEMEHHLGFKTYRRKTCSTPYEVLSKFSKITKTSVSVRVFTI